MPVITAVLGVVGAITAGFTQLVLYLAARASAKVLIVGGAVVAITGLTVALIAALNLLGDSLSASLPAGVIAFSAALLPGNLNACISVIISATVLRWVYDRHIQIIGMLTSG